eukprot:CAMPEP_0174698166 /NCGR_PEP_ID=MMETSP1094-20130205/3821_1 /TAXON_ID=156173 /ORGANISM="Chrysochromulina brevifilum, Strain UTEX LB 985" /LENGTH=143 /DNA_ID=CAMNT_0015895277 /DNA_START=39 /DNA_END=466 /DNA_ORIENTATION=-
MTTLLTACPLEAAVFAPSSLKDAVSCPRTAGRTALQAAAALVFQGFWCTHTAMLPGLLVIGSAILFANSDNALDLVLNSVAVGFIFELDEVCYSQVLPYYRRESYEARQTCAQPPTSALAAPGGQLTVSVASGLTYALDFVVG